jgi:hypothetical protein
MAQCALDGFFPLECIDDFVRRKMSGFESMSQYIERPAIKTPGIERFGRTAEDLISAIEHSLGMHAAARLPRS